MLACREVADHAPVVAFLRWDVFGNNCILDALEHNVPPVPRRVYVAEDEGGICGVMSVEDCGDWIVADLRSAGARPEAMALLARELDSERTYRFSVRSDYWETVRCELAEPVSPFAFVAFTVTPETWRPVGGPGVVRRLTTDDQGLTDAFPAPSQPHQPTASDFVRMAEQDPEREVVFGALLSQELVCYTWLNLVVDNVWETGMIETREQWRGRGLGKQVLSEASRQLLAEGKVILHQVSESNTPSLRTARAAGFYEAFRVIGADARLKQ